MRKTAAPLLAALLLPALAAPAQEARWSRQVEVARPGPVVVELDGRAAARAAIDLEVIAPDGRAVPAALRAGEEGAWPLRVSRVAPTGAGWQVELDAGAAAPPHAGLRFALARDAAAPGVLLEASDDGASWRELVRGDLFRLGAGENLQSFVLSYEATSARFLRLSWPREAGLPELLETALLPAADRGGARRSVAATCSSSGAALECIATPGPLCRTLEIALEPREAALGFSLWQARDGRWQPLGGGERRRHGLLRLELDGGAVYRLRLEGGGPEDASPALEAASCEERRLRLHFSAEAAGVYRLTYGRLAPPGQPLGCTGCGPSPPPGEALALGAESESAPPTWPAAVRPGVALGDGFGRGWPVETEAAAGQLVALPLPAETEGRAGGGVPAGLRLDAGGRQLPYLAEIAPRPERLLAATLHPLPGERGRSRVPLPIPAGAGDAELMLFARGPFERNLRVLRREDKPGRADFRETGAGGLWSCPAALARSCLWSARLGAAPPGRELELELEFLDGDNPPLAAFAAEVWTRRPVLYFVHPGGPVFLRENAALPAPRYDFASLGQLLRREEAAVARLGAPLPGGEPLDAPRWLLPLAVGVAALVLLAVLARMIRHDRTDRA